MKHCKIIFNTVLGYCLTPIECRSIAEAVRLAKAEKMAFRIFRNDECIKSGWYY